MGIRYLNKIIKNYAKDGIIERDVKYYKNSKIAIDAHILVYKTIYYSKCDFSHILWFIHKICYFLDLDILPVFIFDGKTPIEKTKTLENRRNNRKKLKTRAEEIKVRMETEVDIFEKEKLRIQYNKIRKQTIRVKKKHIVEIKYLLKLIGIPYIVAEDEAENYCSSIQKSGMVDYTLTEDSDSFPFGCPKTLKVSPSGCHKINEFNLAIILDCLNLDMDGFIDFCILLGSDYNNGINRYWLDTLELIRKHRNIENIIKYENITIPSDFNYEASRKIFKSSNKNRKPNPSIDIGNTNYKELEKFLIHEKKLPYHIYTRMLKKIKKSLMNYTQ